MQKAAGGWRRGPRVGGDLGGVPPKTPREWTLVHWYPPGGGGGPKKRHLVLYKLAGFSPADRSGCGAFFACIAPRCFSVFSKFCKKCHFLAHFDPKNPHFGPILAPKSPFFRRISGGEGRPLFGGDPPGGRAGGPGGSPPLGGGPRRGGRGGW